MQRIAQKKGIVAWILALQLLAFWPSLHWFYLRSRYASDDRAHLLALCAVGLLWLLRLRSKVERTDSKLSTTFVVGTYGVVVYALMLPFLPAIASALVAVLVLSWSLSRAVGDRGLNLPLWSLGCLSLPILPVFEFHLSLPLRVAVASVASALLRVSGLNVVAEGTSMNWNGQLVWVDPPCSGLHMLWTGLFMTACLCAIWNIGNWACLRIGCTAFLVILCANAMRAASLFLLETDLVVLPSFAHSGIGLAAQCIAAVTIFFVAYRAHASNRNRESCAAI